MKKNAVVIDLDGTLVACNSFVKYVGWIGRKHIQVWVIVLLRKLRLISHSVAKQRVMALEVSDEEIDRFVDFLTGYTRRELLESYQNGDNMIVLATAAPDIYAIRFANKLGINDVCATTKDGQENKGVVKLEGVQKLLADENLILSAVITDHEDDLPLLQFNRHGENILVYPKQSTVEKLDENSVEYSLFLGKFEPA